MTTVTKKLLIVLACMAMMVAGLAVFSSCSGGSVYSVTFMVRENGVSGAWQQYGNPVQTNDDGSVTLPAEPTVDGYTFRDWYKDEAFTQIFDESKVMADITVYALMAETNITLNITDGAGNATQVQSALSALSQATEQYEADALAETLTFDGWYTDANCTQRYSSGMDVTALYGRYMAEVTVEDGYNGVYTVLVTPGTAMSEPAESAVKQYYMGEIEYYTLVDADGNILSKDKNGAAAAFDFATGIERNTTLRVMWASPYLSYERNAATGGLTMTGFVSGRGDSMDSYPVVSIPAYATLNGESEPRLVESVIWGTNVVDVCPGATKIIFADGIKSISGVQANPVGITTVEEIVLPDTLRIIDTAFWNYSSVKGFDIPDGVEIIINSFWGSAIDSSGVFAKSNYSFEIAIPASVKYLSQVPSNFAYAETSAFWYDEATKATYRKGENNDYETLISMYDFGTAATVKEGVRYVQVGAFVGVDFDYLYLPSTFVNVACLANADDYPYYTGGVNDSGYSKGGFRLYKAEGGTTRYGVAIVDTLNIMERVIFDLTERPAALQNNAIQGKIDGSYSFFNALTFDDDDKVIFTGTVAEGETVTVKVRAVYSVTGAYETFTVADKVSGDTLTLNEILTAIGFDGVIHAVDSVTQFGEAYFLSDSEEQSGITVNCRQYIEVVYSDNPGGAIIQLIDGVMTVTGLDAESAQGDAGNGYTVTIPSAYEGVAVTAIADGAFKDEASLITVNIPSSITTIGAEAFMNTINLANVTIAPGGLSVIGRSAFENSGFTTIALPIAGLTDVQPYAFKSDKLEYFSFANGEESRYIGMNLLLSENSLYYSMLIGIAPGLKADELKALEGKFVYLLSLTGGDGAQSLAVYKSIRQDSDGRYCIDVDFVAIAGATKAYYVPIGQDAGGDYYVRYEVLEGSVYYLKSIDPSDSAVTAGITFVHVSKIHKNAFTDLPESFGVVTREATETTQGYVRGVRTSQYFKNDDFNDSSVFEDGWWQGVMSGDPDYAERMAFIFHVQEGSGVLGMYI